MGRNFTDRQESGAGKGMLDLLDNWSLGGRIEVGSLIKKAPPNAGYTFFLSPCETFTKILLG